MTRALRCLVVGVLLGQIACAVQAGPPEIDSVRQRAEALLSALRQKDWGKAASFVLLDDETRQRMGIAKTADPRTAQDRAAAWFGHLYGMLAPGGVDSVVISVQDPNVARVLYRHGDLDAFTMRLVDGEWCYPLNSRDSTLR